MTLTSWTDVDGVPTVHPDDGGRLLHAVLRFRFGVADETLPARGLAHLLEHLVLHALPSPAYVQYNGRVQLFSTTFELSGPPEHVTGLLRQITARLHDPPVEALDHELRVLQQEARVRAGTSAEQQAYWFRWGPNGPGALSYSEFGLRWVTPGEIISFARRHFTRENALLSLVGPVPDDISLYLPAGGSFRRIVMPAPVLTGPGWIEDGPPAASAVTTWSEAAQVAAGLLATHLERARPAYPPAWAQTHSLERMGHLAHLVSGPSGHVRTALDKLLDLLESLSRPDAAQVAAHRDALHRRWSETSPLERSTILVDDWTHATDREALTGGDMMAAAADRLSTVTREDVAEVFAAWRSSLLVSVPDPEWAPHRLPRAQLPTDVGPGQSARRFKDVFPLSRDVLRIDDRALSYGPLTIDLSRAALVLRRPDGEHTIIDANGYVPTVWVDRFRKRDRAALTSLIEAAANRSLDADGAGAPQDKVRSIPAAPQADPEPAPWLAYVFASGVVLPKWVRTALGIIVLLALFAAAIILYDTSRGWAVAALVGAVIAFAGGLFLESVYKEAGR